jgi:hypothetical protein
MKDAEIALKALEILQRDGWCKGATDWSVQDARRSAPESAPVFRLGSHCIGGALGLALHNQPDWIDTEDWAPAVLAKLRELFPDDIAGLEREILCLGAQRSGAIVAAWNDGPATIDQVVQVLEKLAADETVQPE